MKTNEEIKDSLQSQGIVHLNEVFYNLSRAELYEHAISNSEAEAVVLSNTWTRMNESKLESFIQGIH